MAALVLDDTALVVASRGSIFVAAANTAMPAGGINSFAQIMVGKTPPPTITGWERVANTSREALPEFSVEAGDTTSLGTWDTEKVRTVYGASNISWSFRPLQHDADTVIKLANGWAAASGGGAVIGATGWQFAAAYVICVFDGTMVSGFYIPNNDSIMTGLPSLSVNAFSEMQVTNTIKAAATSAIPAHSDGRSGLMQVFDPTAYSSAT